MRIKNYFRGEPMPKKKKKTSKKEVKQTVKKKVSRKTAKKDIESKGQSKEFLASALNELEEQTRNLKNQKRTMERELYLLALDFNDTQKEETKLKEKIAKLVHIEETLNAKKTKTKSELDSLNEKITKVDKINAEMKGVKLNAEMRGMK
jgi:chromosome segregation ATPase